MMKKTALAVTLAASMTFLAACGNDQVLVDSKVGQVTEQELYQEMKEMVGRQVTEGILIEKVLEKEYKVEDKEVNEAFDAQKAMYGESFDLILQQQGMTEDAFKRNMRLQLLQEKLFKDIKVDKKEVDQQFERSKYEVNARHVLVESEEEAKKVEKLLADGKKFEDVAKEHSTEPAAQESGGNLDWFGPGKMVPAFDDAVFDMKKGERRIVKTDFGYHVIELIDKREVEMEDADAQRQEIENKMKEDLAEEKMIELVRAADIKIKDDDLKGVFAAFLEQPEKEEKKEEKK